MNINEIITSAFLTHKKKILVIVLISLVSGIAFSIVHHPSLPFATGNGEEKNNLMPGITTVTISIEDVQKKIPVMGNITYRDKATISSKIFGRVEKLYAEQGDFIHKGRPLVKIETHSLELQKKEAMAEMDGAKAALRLCREKLLQAEKSVEQHLTSIAKSRIELQDSYVTYNNTDDVLHKKEQLFKVGGLSETELNSHKTTHSNMLSKFLTAKKNYEMLSVGYRNEDIKKAGYTLPGTEKDRNALLTRINTGMERSEVQAAESNLRKIKTSIQILERNIHEATIRSPISGIVAIRNIDIGEKVKEDTNLFVVMNIQHLYMVVNINEKESTQLKKGQSVSFIVDALQGKKFKGTVHLVSPILDTATRTVEVKILCLNSDNQLKPGMFARAEIFTRTFNDAMVIPAKCVKNLDGDAPTVFVCREGMVFGKTIVTGEHVDEETILVTEGLVEGDRIAVSHVQLLKDKMKVTYEEKENDHVQK